MQGLGPLPLGDGEDEVSEKELGVELRDDGLAVAGDGDDAELPEVFRGHGLNELGEFEVEQGRVLVELEHGDLELAVREFHRLRRRVVVEEADYLVRRYPFRIEHHLDAHLFEQQLVLGGQELLVADPCDDLRGPESLCEQGPHDVDFLRSEGIHGDIQVGPLNSGLLQDFDR